MNNSAIKNWIPYRLVDNDGQLQFNWLDTFNTPFTEPFFDETVSRLRYKRRNSSLTESVSDLEMFEKWALLLPDVTPSAIIFHISRCGSTLVSQMLATTNNNIVLPEVRFFDHLLRLPYQHSHLNADMASRLFNTALKYYGQKKTPNEQHIYIKADSWHIFFYEQLRKLYPEVPFILMYRNPNEVFNSHKKQAGMQAVPGLIEPGVFGFTEDERHLHPDPYLALVLERYLSKYLKITEIDNRCLLVNYNEGPMPIMQKITAFTGISLSEDIRLKMAERSRYHSKKPDEVFSEIAVIRIPPLLNKAMELYHNVEEKRTNILV